VKIKQRVPHIGCTTSHLICVINFFEKNKDDNIVIVLEDDSIPFKGLTTNDLNEYLNILKEKWYLFEIANMSPMSWNFNFQSKNKSIKWKHAPDHYSFVYDCDGICFGNFLVYSRNSVSILKDIYENFITEEIQIPIVIDRIWNLSYGGYKLPFLRMLVPNSTFAYQNDSFSNNENKLVNFASKKILNQMHSIVKKLFENDREDKEDDLQVKISSYLYRHKDDKKSTAKVTLVIMFFPEMLSLSNIKSDEYLQNLKNILQNVHCPMTIYTLKKNTIELKSYRPLNWPLEIISFENFHEFLHNIVPTIIPNSLKASLSKPFCVKEAIHFLKQKNKETKYYYFIDLGSLFINENKTKLNFFPSYSKIDMTFFKNEKDPLLDKKKVIFQKKLNLNSSNGKLNWDFNSDHFIGTRSGIQFLCEKIKNFVFEKKNTDNDECFLNFLTKMYPDEFEIISSKNSSEFYTIFNDHDHDN